MKLSLIFLIVIGCVIAAAEECTKEEIKEYRKWQRKYNKPHYRDSEEQQRRCQILNQRREDIKSSDSDRRMHRSGLNEYSDLTEQEMHDTRYGYVAPSDDEPTEPVRDDKNKYPPSKDWRDDGIITAIKNQGQCGSCWSFAVTGVIEAHMAQKTGNLVALSEQNIIDCNGGNKDCHGETITKAGFGFVKTQGGLETEDTYPYVSGKTHRANKKCQYDSANSAGTVSEIKRLPKYDTESMLNVVGNIGPLAVSIDASGKTFHHYKSGIYNNPKCSNEKLSHAVLVVGYGTDTTNSTGLGDVDYWIVKNSWGTSWGDNGYIYFARDNNVMKNCGISKHPSYVLV